MKKAFLMTVIALTVLCTDLCAKSVSFIIRPEVSLGYMSTFDENHAVVENYGMKLLMGITEKQRFGIKVDYIRNDFGTTLLNREYIGVGLVLEQVLFNFFNMGIGTVGYIALDTTDEASPFGVYTHLGYEHRLKNGILFLIAYQADFIFNHKFGLSNALKIGVGYQF